MSIASIKAAIKTNLDELVTATTLKYVKESDLKTDPLAADPGIYPAAYLMPPALQSEVLDNRTVMRTYSFDILVLFQGENLQTTSELEEAIEDIITKFDNDPTLGGTALGGMLPVSSAPEPFQRGSKDMVMVVLTIQAKEPVNLTFA